MYKVLIGAGLGLLLGVLAMQAPAPTTDDEAKQRSAKLEEQVMQSQLEASQPDADSPDWKQLNEEVGLMLEPNRHGLVVARLFVRQGSGSWHAIPVAGVRDLAPGVMPAQKP